MPRPGYNDRVLCTVRVPLAVRCGLSVPSVLTENQQVTDSTRFKYTMRCIYPYVFDATIILHLARGSNEFTNLDSVWKIGPDAIAVAPRPEGGIAAARARHRSRVKVRGEARRRCSAGH